MFNPNESDFSERQLVCEGLCNPDVRDFDAAHARVSEDVYIGRERRIADDTMKEWTKRLRHTPHIPETSTSIYRQDIGWCRAWRCVECGHRRFY